MFSKNRVSKKNTLRNRQLSLESLEDRRVMAVYAQLVKDFSPDNQEVYYQADNFIKIGNQTFFTHTSNSGAVSLWRTDGTPNGTIQLDTLPGELYPRAADGTNEAVARGMFQNYQGKLLYPTNTGLKITDGTPAGTKVFLANSNEADNSIPNGNKIYNGLDNSTFANFRVVNSTVFFVALTGIKGSNEFGELGYELWKTDGTANGTQFVKDVNPSDLPITDYRNLINVNGVLFFTANDGVHGRELWKSNGTSGGTVRLTDFAPNDTAADPVRFSDLPTLGFQNYPPDLYFTVEVNNQSSIYSINQNLGNPKLLTQVSGINNVDFFGFQNQLF